MSNFRRLPIAACLAFALLFPAALWAAAPLPLIGRELFVDRHLIAHSQGVELRLGQPQPAGTALTFDRPWEGAFCGYVTVLVDHGKYRMYYRGLPEAGVDGTAIESTCLAESADGIAWTKPNVGAYEVLGSRDNNVVLKDQTPASHNFSPFVDRRPDVPADERYKALGGTSQSGLIAFVSGDGVHWRRWQDAPVFQDTGWVFDSQNVAFWSQAEKKYLLYYRRSPAGVRAVARATSDDFRHWSAPEQMTTGDGSPEHLYTNQTHPYFRAPQLYVGVAARFMPGRKVLSDEQARAIQVDPRYFGDISDAVLLTSRGGNAYERTFREGFVRPGIGWENWTSRTNYPALGIVPTGPAEMSLYIQKNYGQPTARLDRYALRTDGLASVHAGSVGGMFETPVLDLGGQAAQGAVDPGSDGPALQLSVNYSTSAAGSVLVEICDEAGAALPGYSRDDCEELIGDEIDRPLRWRGRTSLFGVAHRPVKLRFHLRDADLFAISCEWK